MSQTLVGIICGLLGSITVSVFGTWTKLMSIHNTLRSIERELRRQR